MATTPDKVAAIARGGRRRADGGRRAAGAQAHAGPWPRDRRQPSSRCRSSTTDRATLEATDFAAFRPLAKLPLGMTAHVVFSAIDPVAPATTSVTMVREVIRGIIGFDGLLMSDDVSMNALSGTLAERSARRARGRLRRRASLQRQARRDARRSRTRARRSPATRSGAPMRRSRRGASRRRSMLRRRARSSPP